ncbi:MAG: hypothetical protein JST11_07990 [Acidobacteria bacterium]|nr:hypothetical protein [Acidobacteriota bacterium]
MATTMHNMERDRDDRFVVIHPLDDLPETKVDIEGLGPMPMTAGVRMALFSLRAYLVLMTVLVLYHVLDLAKVFG